MRHLKSPCFVAAAVLMLGACSDASDRPLTGPVGPRLALLGPLSAGHLALQAEFTPLLNSVYACADATQNRKYTDALKKIDKYAREGDFARVAVAVEELIQNTESLLSSGKLATDCAGFDPDAAEQAFALLRTFAGIEGDNEAIVFCEPDEDCVATVPGDDGAKLEGKFAAGVVLSIIKKLDGFGTPNAVGNAWTFQCFGPSGPDGCDPPAGITKKICFDGFADPNHVETDTPLDPDNIFIGKLIGPAEAELFATFRAEQCDAKPEFLGMLPANPLLRSVHQAAATLSTFFIPKPLYASHIRGHYYANSGEPPTGLSDWGLEHHLPTTASCETLSELTVAAGAKGSADPTNNAGWDLRVQPNPYTKLVSIRLHLSAVEGVSVQARRFTHAGQATGHQSLEDGDISGPDGQGFITVTWPSAQGGTPTPDADLQFDIYKGDNGVDGDVTYTLTSQTDCPLRNFTGQFAAGSVTGNTGGGN